MLLLCDTAFCELVGDSDWNRITTIPDCLSVPLAGGQQDERCGFGHPVAIIRPIESH